MSGIRHPILKNRNHILAAYCLALPVDLANQIAALNAGANPFNAAAIDAESGNEAWANMCDRVGICTAGASEIEFAI